MPSQAIDPALIKAAHDAIAKHGSLSVAARALGVPRTTLQGRLNMSIPKDAPKNGTAIRKGKALSEFRLAHDKSYLVPLKIKQGLAALGDGWEYEMEFCRLAGVSASDLSSYREQFAEHYVVVGRTGKRAWAGSKSLADKMRQMV